MKTLSFVKVVLTLLILASLLPGQKSKKDKPAATPGSPQVATEDISGMYSFLKEGEFLQINVQENMISGYISRQGDLESDRGQFLDQFFSKATIRGRDISFTTKPIHGVWFEFKGRFDRGPGKTRAEDAFYVLRGTLTEFRSDVTNKATSRAREVEFKSLGQPNESNNKEMAVQALSFVG